MRKKKPQRDEETRDFRRYRAHVDKVINECSLIARNIFGWNMQVWAEHADVSDQTIYSLLTRKTRYPRYHTVYSLARAVGCEIWVKQPKKKAAVTSTK